MLTYFVFIPNRTPRFVLSSFLMVTDTFEYNIPTRKGNKSHGCKAVITQFAMKLAWASTCHKLQGVTIKNDSILIVHGHKRMPVGMAYVMLSRCAKFESVYIDDKFDFEKIKYY